MMNCFLISKKKWEKNIDSLDIKQTGYLVDQKFFDKYKEKMKGFMEIKKEKRYPKCHGFFLFHHKKSMECYGKRYDIH